jgi:hypothetical protein
VISILAHRDATQRALIQQEYRAVFNQDLARRIASELSGHHKRGMLLWILDPAARDATILKQALTGDITDLRAATEIVCSRTPSQLHIMRQTYRARFGCHVEHDVTERTSGDHQRLLLAYLAIPRCEGAAADQAAAALDARDLYRAGERRLGTDERAFIRVFSERGWAHLAAVARAYRHMYDRSLEEAVKGETSGSFGFGLLTILRCADSPARYFAKVGSFLLSDIAVHHRTSLAYSSPWLFLFLLLMTGGGRLAVGAAQGDEGAGHERLGADPGGGDAGGDRHAVHQGGVPQDVQALARRRHPLGDLRELPHLPPLPRRERPRLLLITVMSQMGLHGCPAPSRQSSLCLRQRSNRHCHRCVPVHRFRILLCNLL